MHAAEAAFVAVHCTLTWYVVTVVHDGCAGRFFAKRFVRCLCCASHTLHNWLATCFAANPWRTGLPHANTRHNTTRDYAKRHGTARHDTAWHDTARHGTARHISPGDNQPKNGFSTLTTSGGVISKSSPAGGWMGGWVDGWVDGWMGGWVDRWMGGWVGGNEGGGSDSTCGGWWVIVSGWL